MNAILSMATAVAAVVGPLALAIDANKIRDLYIETWVRLQNAVERVERNELNVEHAGNELLWELPHLSEQIPHIVAAITG